MAKNIEAHAPAHITPPLPKQLAPSKCPQQIDELRSLGHDHHAIFIELRQRVSRGAALRSAFMSQLADMAAIEHRLRPRKGKPYQGVEQVVPVFLAMLDAAGLRHARLVPDRRTLTFSRRTERDALTRGIDDRRPRCLRELRQSCA